MKFVLNVNTIKNTQIEAYINLAVKEKAPEIYKPRVGVVNGNKKKFSEAQL
jgi:hypothetical protein